VARSERGARHGGERLQHEAPGDEALGREELESGRRFDRRVGVRAALRAAAMAARREGPWSPSSDRGSSRRTTGACIAAPLVSHDRTSLIAVARIRSLTGDVPDARRQESDAGDER
jgi:hypothetical protein